MITEKYRGKFNQTNFNLISAAQLLKIKDDVLFIHLYNYIVSAQTQKKSLCIHFTIANKEFKFLIKNILIEMFLIKNKHLLYFDNCVIIYLSTFLMGSSYSFKRSAYRKFFL